MTLDELSLILEELRVPCDHLKLGGKNGNRVMISCPYAEWTHPSGSDSRPSMAIWLEEETSCKYKCWTCHESGNLWELIQDIGNLSGRPEVQALAFEVQRTDRPRLGKILAACGKRAEGWGVPKNAQTKSPILSSSLLSHYPDVSDNCEGGKYLARADRAIPLSVAKAYDVKIHASGNRLLFPVLTRKREFQGFVGRDITDAQSAKYYNYFNLETSYVLGGLQHVTSNTRRVLIVEGFFDVLGLARWLTSGEIIPLCTFKAELGEMQARQLLALDVVIDLWYDGDDAGQAGAMRASTLLKNMGGTCKITQLPRHEDPHALNFAQINQLLNETRT